MSRRGTTSLLDGASRRSASSLMGGSSVSRGRSEFGNAEGAVAGAIKTASRSARSFAGAINRLELAKSALPPSLPSVIGRRTLGRMDTAIAGILGVIAGAITTGGTQIWLVSRQRHNDALGAVRLTWGAFANAAALIERAADEGTWAIDTDALELAVSTWEANRMAVARAVDGLDFRTLEIAALQFRSTHKQAGSFDDAGLKRVTEDPGFPEGRAAFQEAVAVALRAGQTRWERIRYPRRRKKLNARLDAAAQGYVTTTDTEEVALTGEHDAG
jgi:hypothetical protein